MTIMEYNANKIDNEKIILPSLMKMCSIFQMRFWYDKEYSDKNDVKTVAIRCSDCGKETFYL